MDCVGGMDHKHVYSSVEFLRLLKKHYTVMKILGFWYLPRIPKTERFEMKWWFGKHLRLLKSCRKIVNMLGFQTIVLLKKTS